MYFYANNIWVRFEDISKVWVTKTDDMLHIKLLDGTRQQCKNGEGLLKELKNLMRIYALKDYLENYNISPSALAQQIGVSAPAVINLFKNVKLSNNMKQKIEQLHSMVFNEYDKKVK